MAWVRRVRTASGATAVQIAESTKGRRRIVRHVGSARTDAELGILLEQAQQLLEEDQQGVLDLGLSPGIRRASMLAAPAEPTLFATTSGPPARQLVPRAAVLKATSQVLYDALAQVYASLGFDVLDDPVFRDLVIARLVEPTSLLDVDRVLAGMGRKAPSLSTRKRTLIRAYTGDYRAKIAAACFAHATSHGDLTLVLFDVTTLYFEAEHEDDLRKVGYSKERRVDPQVVVGLLVDRAGFPLEITCWEGNKAETATILPTIRAFQQRHALADFVVVADAGMLSTGNLKALDEAGMRFIVGSRQTKAPTDLASHFRWHGDALTDGQLIDTITPRHAGATSENDDAKKTEPVWDPTTHPKSWRAVWAYSAKRAARDGKTLTLQENRAKAVVAGERGPRTPRFVTIHKGDAVLDDKALARARRLVGLKGYVSNIPAAVMPAAEVVASYHDLWHVEQSFRMSKTDLRARPFYARTRQAIEAHLTIVMTALAVGREVQARTRLSLRRVVRTLQPLRAATVHINGDTITIPAHIPPTEAAILDALNGRNPRH